MNLLLCILTIFVLNHVELKASYTSSYDTDDINLKPVYQKIDSVFSTLMSKTPYPTNQDGSLEQPKNLTMLLNEVNAITCQDLCFDLNKGIEFLIKAASERDYIDCIVWVFLYTNLIQRLRDNNQLDSTLRNIRNACWEYFKNKLFDENEYKDCYEHNNRLDINTICVLFPITPFFSTDEFIHKHLIRCCWAQDFFRCNNLDVLRMLFVSVLINKNHVIIMLLNEFGYDNIKKKFLNFNFESKNKYTILLKYACLTNKFGMLRYLLQLQSRSEFDSNCIKLSKNEINEIINYANNSIPNDIRDWIETKYLTSW